MANNIAEGAVLVGFNFLLPEKEKIYRLFHKG